MANITGVKRPLLSLSLPLLLILGGAAVAAERNGADVTLASEAADGPRTGTKATTGVDEVGGKDGTTVTTTPPTTVPPASSTTPTTAPPAPPTTEAPAPPVTEAPRQRPVAPPVEEPAYVPEPPAEEPYVPPAPPVTEAPAPPPPPPVVGPPSNGDISAVVDHHNANRVAAGLAPLSYNSCLGNLAQIWSNTLANVLFTLIHQTGLGGLIGSCLPDWRMAGENIGYSGTAADVAEGFWESPHHQDNIMDPRFSQIGVGAVRDGTGTIWITVLFGG